jgi:hypothetical protein
LAIYFNLNVMLREPEPVAKVRSADISVRSKPRQHRRPVLPSTFCPSHVAANRNVAMPPGIALVPKFRTELRPSRKPRRSRLFIDRDCKPIYFLFVFRRCQSNARKLIKRGMADSIGYMTLCIAPPKNKRKWLENCAVSINRQPLRGLDPLQLACSNPSGYGQECPRSVPLLHRSSPEIITTPKSATPVRHVNINQS